MPPLVHLVHPDVIKNNWKYTYILYLDFRHDITMIQCIKIQYTSSNHFIHFPHRKFSSGLNLDSVLFYLVLHFCIYYFQTQKILRTGLRWKTLEVFLSTSQDTWLWNMLLFQLWRCLVRPSSVLLLLCKRGFCWALGATALHPICKLCRFFLPPSDGTFKASLRTLTSEDFKMTSARLRLPTGTCRGSCEHLNGKWSLWRAASFCKGVGLSWNWTAIPPFSLV